jgi:hypothetical protein
VTNETFSLTATVATLISLAGSHVHELLIVVCERTGADSLKVIEELKKRYGAVVKVHRQSLPFLGGAIREAFELASGSHVLMMSSDLETNPADVKRFIDEAVLRPNAVVTASRWRGGGKFEGYEPLKLFANFIFQSFFSFLYNTALTDLTFGYRLFPRALVRAIVWEELRHSFMFETIVKPLRLGVEVVEIPSNWRARREGTSQNTFWQNFLYFRTGLRTRFARPCSLLRA